MVRYNSFFTVLAFSFILFVCSGSVAAQPLSCQDSISEMSDHGLDSVADCIENAMDLKVGASFNYGKIYFQLLASYMNVSTPYDIDYGMELSSVSLEGNSINYNINCDYMTCMSLDLSDDAIDEFKYNLALALYDIFDEIGFGGDKMATLMESLGMEFNYILNVGAFQDEVMTITVTGDYIINASLSSKGIYPI